MSEMNPLLRQHGEKILLKTSHGELEMNRQTEEHLRSLEGYGKGLTEEQHAEKRKETTEKILEEQTLVMERFKELHPAEVDKTAPGEPVQQVKPAEVSWKERRQRKRETEEVHKKHGLTTCDYRSLRAVNALHENKEQRLNSYIKANANGELENPNCHGQHRVANVLTKPVKLDKTGQPLTEEDRQNQTYNDQMYAAFKQVDFSQAGTPQQLEAFRPYFDRMVNELLGFTFTPQMNTDDYILSHAVEMNHISSLLTNLSDMYSKFTFFKGYLDEMQQKEPQKKKVLDTVYENCAKIALAITVRFNAQGVDPNGADYLHPAGIPAFRGMLTGIVQDQMFEKSIKEVSVAKADALAYQYRDEEMANQPMMKQTLKDETGVDFTGFVTGYSYDTLTDVKRWIAENPERYRANEALVDRQYQKLYKALDSLGDITLQVKTLQSAVDVIKRKYPNGGADISTFTKEDRDALFGLTARQESLDSGELTMIKDYVSGIQDYLQHVLRGKELSEGGQLYMEHDLRMQEREKAIELADQKKKEEERAKKQEEEDYISMNVGDFFDQQEEELRKAEEEQAKAKKELEEKMQKALEEEIERQKFEKAHQDELKRRMKPNSKLVRVDKQTYTLEFDPEFEAQIAEQIEKANLEVRREQNTIVLDIPEELKREFEELNGGLTFEDDFEAFLQGQRNKQKSEKPDGQ